MRNPARDVNIIAVALGAAFFLLYTLTAAPSIVTLYDDSLEFQLVGPTFGIAHPTGYPLYTLLGGLWSRALFPFGNWAWRMNLFSALAAAMTVALLFLLTQEVVKRCVLDRAHSTPSVTAGIFAAVAFGLSPIWWSQATVAEVYALHNLLVVTALLLAVRLVDTNLATVQTIGRTTLLAFVLGLGLSHHRTIVLLGPGLLLMLWGQRWFWRPSWVWLRWGIVLLAPLLLYLYLPLRAAMGVRDLNGSYVNSWAGFWDHALARGYAGFFSENALTRTLSTDDWTRLWLAQYGWIGLSLGVLGLGWLVVRGRNRRIALALVGVLLTNVAFAVAYRVGDPEVFMLPAWLSFAPLIGVAVAALRQVRERRLPVARAVQALLLFVVMIGIDGRGAPVNRRQDWAIHDYAVALAKVDFPPESRVIGLEGQITALRYMQAAEGLGEQAEGVVANDPTDRVAAIAAAVQGDYPTYLTQEVAGIAEEYSFSGEGPLVRVWPRGMAEIPAPTHPLTTPFADGKLLLVGYDLLWLEEAGGPSLRLALYWQPQTTLQHEYKISLRLLRDDGTPLTWPTGAAVAADRFPLRQVAPTTTWAPGEIVRDVQDLAIPFPTADAATLRVILYDAATVVEAGAVDLPLPPAPPRQ
jgi:hypothetical protein